MTTEPSKLPNPAAGDALASVPQAQGKILVLGLGNDILRDDAIGLHVVREIRRRLGERADIVVQETGEMGLSLLDYIVGFRGLVLVDAVQTRQAPAGHLHEVGLGDLKILPLISPHFLGIGEIVAVGRQLGMVVPDEVRILAVEVEDPFTLHTEMTDALRAALPIVVERVMAVVGELAGRR